MKDGFDEALTQQAIGQPEQSFAEAVQLSRQVSSVWKPSASTQLTVHVRSLLADASPTTRHIYSAESSNHVNLIVCDAALLLHFAEFAMRVGALDLASAAYASSVVVGSRTGPDVPDVAIATMDRVLQSPHIADYEEHAEGLQAAFTWLAP